MEPFLATEWNQVEPTTWEFTLREDVSFQDDKPMDADAVTAAAPRSVAPVCRGTVRWRSRWSARRCRTGILAQPTPSELAGGVPRLQGGPQHAHEGPRGLAPPGRILVNAVSPATHGTEMSPDADRPFDQGADTAVGLATLPDDGPPAASSTSGATGLVTPDSSPRLRWRRWTSAYGGADVCAVGQAKIHGRTIMVVSGRPGTQQIPSQG